MKKLLTKKIINKYILDEFGEIPNPITKDEIIQLINNHKLTLEGVKLWSLFGGDLMIKDDYDYGNTILHSASYMGQLDIVEYVLDKGVDIDSLNIYTETPLIIASQHNYINIINVLLEKGANINYQTNNGWTALHCACSWNQLNTVKVLVENDINIQLKNRFNNTGLDVAKYHKHQQIIDYLTPFYNTK